LGSGYASYLGVDFLDPVRLRPSNAKLLQDIQAPATGKVAEGDGVKQNRCWHGYRKRRLCGLDGVTAVALRVAADNLGSIAILQCVLRILMPHQLS
jgi:hypothetical protein